MTDSRQEGVPLSHALGTGTVGQPQRRHPSLKVLASRVLGKPRETVPLSRTLGAGTLGQAEANRAKPEGGRAEEWDAEDWRVYFEERAGIAEFDGEQTRADAEAVAFERCIVEWLNRHLEHSDPDRCAWCEKPDRDTHAVVPFGTENHGHTWVHPECWNDWHRNRLEKARQALAAMGLKNPPRAGETGAATYTRSDRDHSL